MDPEQPAGPPAGADDGMPDRSEEQFAASLEAKAPPSAGDGETTALRQAIAAAYDELRQPRPATGQAALLTAIDAALFAAQNPRVPTATRALRSAIAGELDSARHAGAAATPEAPAPDRGIAIATLPPEASATAAKSDPEPVFNDEPEWNLVSASAPRSHGAVMNEPEWKQEVASRLENYRSRRGSRRPRHEGSLSLDFERAMNRMVSEEPAAGELAITTETDYVSQAVAAFSDAATVPVAAPVPEQQPEPEPEFANNLIEFPRAPTLFEPFAPPTGDELAEPMIDRPRIIEAPEEVHCAQAPLAGIELEAEEPETPPELELPLRVAPLGQRVFAALLDALLVALGTAIFLTISRRGEVSAPPGKLGWVLVAALPALLWGVYEYLFLVHAGRTPGMQMARLAMTDFEGMPPGRRVRRVRALASVLSLCALGLGLLWALLDEDALCWHDRISRTYEKQMAAD